MPDELTLMVQRLSELKDALSPDDQKILDDLLQRVINYAKTNRQSDQEFSIETILVALLLEQRKEILQLRNDLRELQSKMD